jgi:hypothetical protein
MPNDRLRQIYVAMAQARALGRSLPARRGHRSTVGLEASLVSPTIDLGTADLVSDAISGGVLEFLRGTVSGGKRKRLAAECGHAAQLASPPGAAERTWTALGAAAALKAEAATRRSQAKPDSGDPAASSSVVVAYLWPGELQAALWRKAMTFAAEQLLPVIFVVLPPAASPSLRAARLGAVSTLALSCGVPGIAVDGDDAVALYRVAQESIGHARSGGGPALMECIPFVLPATAGRKAPRPDAIAGLAEYILGRRVATQAWMDREAKVFAKKMAADAAASG